MRKIKPKDIKIGDFVYLVDKKDETRRYILEKISNKKGRTFKWWVLEKKLKKTNLFEIAVSFNNSYYSKGIADMDDKQGDNMAFMDYTTYKLNKKEVLKFTKLLILKNLE